MHTENLKPSSARKSIRKVNVLALDLSYTCTGIAYFEGEKLVKAIPLKLGVPSYPFHSRIKILERVISPYLVEGTHVVIEGAAFDANYRAQALGELAGAVKYILGEKGIPYTVIPPTSARKIAVGNGGAKKEEVAKIIAEKYCYKNNSLDVTDAFCLAIAFRLGYTPEKKVPKKRLAKTHKYGPTKELI